MEKTVRIAQMEDRLNKLLHSSKNIKSPGVVKKLRRQIRSLEKSLS